MSKRKLLEQINIKEPCSESWDEMTGSDEVRFCGHCNLNVNNLSAMTRRKALKIVKKANGRICVRYMQNPVDKKPVFGDKIYQITRRAGIAAGVLGASLTLSTLAYGQAFRPNPTADTEFIVEFAQNNSEQDEKESPTAEIAGTVTDSGGGFAYDVSVNLINLDSDENLEAKTDNDGFYKFENVRQGNYKIVINDEKGIAEVSFLEISGASENRQDIALNVPTIIEETIEVLPTNTEIYVSGGAMIVEISYENPLSMAVWQNDEETVRNLIAKGANVNIVEKDHDNITPLFLAVENGNLQIAETLLNFGADVNARDSTGKTPLMRLDYDANAEIVRLFIKHGAKINAVDDDGNTALILAAEYADADVLQALIDGGADVNARNKEGRTALMEAAYGDDLASVKRLILGGADVNFKDSEGKTALDLTTDEAVEVFLKSYGAIGKDE